MRTVLHQYFRPEQSDFERLWKEALICFDASVLLNLYGYSEETRDNLIDVITHYAERTRLPYQFAKEYARNRATTIVKQIKNYQATEKEFEQIASKRLQPKREHPFLSEDALKSFESIRDELASKRKALEKMVSSDHYADVLLKSFESKVGQPPESQALQKLHADADARYAIKTPPGYMDLKDKGVPDAYGDYIGWCQLMDIARKEKKDFILVIDDFKEDWWQKDDDRTLGPRPELLEDSGIPSFLKHRNLEASCLISGAKGEREGLALIQARRPFHERGARRSRFRTRHTRLVAPERQSEVALWPSKK